MFKTIGKHCLRLGALLVAMLPLVVLSIWLLQTFNPHSVKHIVDQAWLIGTLIRTAAYYLFIEIYFTQKVTSNLGRYRQTIDDTWEKISTLNGLNQTNEPKLTDEIVELTEYIDDVEQRIESVQWLQQRLNYLWVAALMFESALQFSYFLSR